MKIVHIITRLIVGGAQENTVLTCREQARLGHDVTLLAGPPEGPEGSMVDAARAAVRTVLVPPLVRPVRPLTDLEAYADLAKHLRDIRPDVVHTHSSKAGILGRLAARRSGVGCIVHTIHGLPFDQYQGWAARWAYCAAERRAACWSDRLIAVSRDMAEKAEEAGLAPHGSVAVVYSGMDTERIRAAAGERDAVRLEWGAEPQDFVFLKVARLFHMKGHEFVLPAFAEVLRTCPRAMLVLAGGGILRLQLETLAARLGVSGRVRFIGLVPPQQMPGVLWAADAVVHAGLREGLARVLPQAGLCRKPVVAYDVGGAREVVRDGENGFLLAAPSPADVCQWRRALLNGETCRELAAGPPSLLAGAMERLASDPASARRMGERWPEEVLAQFDYRLATREIMRVYEEARAVKICASHRSIKERA